MEAAADLNETIDVETIEGDIGQGLRERVAHAWLVPLHDEF
jgi:hypothetical protein